MKKLLCVIFAVAAVLCLMIFLPAKKQETEYMRLVVLANSELSADQLAKLEIQEQVTTFVTPLLVNKNFDEAKQILTEQNPTIHSICTTVLNAHNLDYNVNVKLEKRAYSTDASQHFDTLIIELGNALETNDFSLIYPPLNFVNNFENKTQISFKSKLVDWFKSIFN